MRTVEGDMYFTISGLRDEVACSMTRLEESMTETDARLNALLDDDGVSRRFHWIWHQLDMIRMLADGLAERIAALEARGGEPDPLVTDAEADESIYLNFRDHGYLSESGGFPESEMPEFASPHNMVD